MRRAQARGVYERPFATPEGETVDSENIYSSVSRFDMDAPMDSWRCRYVKRAIDLFCAIGMILIFAVPGLLIAGAILLTSAGPVFYREERIGRDGRRFKIWKFRSMHRHAPHQSRIGDARHDKGVLEWRMRKHLRDPRVTAVGAFLRKWSLDELPQLYNVLRGEMSLIGPRPIVASEASFYGELIVFYLAATPGLSGLWQISGRSNIDYAHRAKLDAMYVQTWSLSTDLNILIRTVPAVVSRVGAR